MQPTVVFHDTADIITAVTTTVIMVSTKAIELRCIMELATDLITELRIDPTTVAATATRPTEATAATVMAMAADQAFRSDAVASRFTWDAKSNFPNVEQLSSTVRFPEPIPLAEQLRQLFYNGRRKSLKSADCTDTMSIPVSRRR